jgi:hypothetical protein
VRRIFFPAILILAALACVVPSQPSPSPLPDTAGMDSLGTAIVQTAVAAQDQTATAQPTPTQTGLPTASPIVQPPTSTPFSLFTPGVLLETIAPEFAVTLTLAAGAPNLVTPVEPVPYSGLPWSCVVRRIDPPRGAKVAPEREFYVTWTAINTGTKNWTTTTIDFVYRTGYRHEGKPIQDLWKNVPSGGSINLRVLFKAPKVEGEYPVYWALKVGNKEFCQLWTRFEVVKP